MEPSYYSVNLLMTFDGANGATQFVEQSFFNAAFQAFGTARLSTAQSKFGASSLALDGSGSYIATSKIGLAILADEFTIEFHVKTARANSVALDFYPGWQVFISASGQVQFWTGGAAIATSSLSVADNNWHHVAVCRAAGTVRIFIDGAISATAQNSIALGTQSVFAIGAQVASRNAAYDMVGYIDNVRIVNRLALYDAAFVAPTAAFVLTPMPLSAAAALRAVALTAMPLKPFQVAATAAQALQDVYNGGPYQITGTVTTAGPPDLPAARMVRLHLRSDGSLVRQVWSDSAGRYAFVGIAKQLYYVATFDHTGNQNAVIKDAILPERAP